MNLWPAISLFFQHFFLELPGYLARLLIAWAIVFCLLLPIFRAIKKHLRPHILKADEHLRGQALSLRYRGQDVFGSERVGLTWFFRFWTNFASAPSLSFWSLVVAVWAFAHALSNSQATGATVAWHSSRLWLLPGLCFSGSMLLSNVLKRVFKRLRPERAPGAFGHKMKDSSFPSGHSLTSFSFWAMTTITFALAGFSPAFVALFGVLALTIVALTGLSRVYMGVHFPSDVFGGYSIGAIWTLASFLALRSAF